MTSEVRPPLTAATRRGEPLPAHLLDDAERMSREELGTLQLSRLRTTLRYAYDNVELYRGKFDDAGVAPEDCRSLEDLARFPFTTKADLRDAYPFGMFAVPMDRIRRVHASSGTTGRPTVVGYTEQATSPCGRTSSPARSARPAAAPATRCTSPTATACSPAASAPTTAPNGPVVR